MKLTVQDASVLIRLARISIETFFTGKIVSLDEAQKYSEHQGAFVTLKLFEKLRGCIGYPEPTLPLNKAIVDASRSAAFKDPRFPPLMRDELEDITIEITILTQPELLSVEDPIQYLDLIKIGKHGLIIKKGFNSGLLLPQVFTEYECTPKKALELTCEKAGLDIEAWKDPLAEVFVFSGQVFKETEPHGKIVEEQYS